MAKSQKWSIELSGEMHSVEYTPKTLLSKAKIRINGKMYPIHSAKLFGASQEVFMLGSERAIISIAKNKKATLSVDSELIKEI
jgi:hypothetical protein